MLVQLLLPRDNEDSCAAAELLPWGLLAPVTMLLGCRQGCSGCCKLLWLPRLGDWALLVPPACSSSCCCSHSPTTKDASSVVVLHAHDGSDMTCQLKLPVMLHKQFVCIWMPWECLVCLHNLGCCACWHAQHASLCWCDCQHGHPLCRNPAVALPFQ
jgi:hypothetical protein